MEWRLGLCDRFFFSRRRRHTRWTGDWSSDVCSSDLPGICYLRTSRPKTAVLYGPDEKFPVPGLKVLRQSANDAVTVIGAGITLYEALKAYDELKSRGTAIRVIDLYCVK